MNPMSVAFDTLKAARRLSEAGADEKLAEAIVGTFAEGITENLATKEDIALIRKDAEALETKIDTSIELLNTRIESSARNTIIWLGGLMFVLVSALGVLERFFPPPG